MTELCICQSGKMHSQCCQRFLNGQSIAKTPVQLMRSRYSAYALGGYGDYLLKTWSPSQHQAMTSAQLSIKSTHWVGLEIIQKSQKGDKAMVEFKATYLSDDEKLFHHERSTFERIKGQWFYLTGNVF